MLWGKGGDEEGVGGKWRDVLGSAECGDVCVGGPWLDSISLNALLAVWTPPGGKQILARWCAHPHKTAASRDAPLTPGYE